MRKIILIVFLLPLFAIAQKRTLTIAPTYTNLSSDYRDKAGGLHIAGLQQVYKGLYAGLSVDVIGITGIPGPYTPIAANIMWRTSSSAKKLSGVFVLEPGYSPYSHKSVTTGRGGGTTQYKGGATFFGGAGLQTPTKKRVQALVMAGYSSFTTSRKSFFSEAQSLFSGASIRIGIVFH